MELYPRHKGYKYVYRYVCSSSAPGRACGGIVKTIRSAPGAPAVGDADLVAVKTDKIEVDQARCAGPVHVGHQMWKRLGVDDVLAGAGLSARGRVGPGGMSRNRGGCPLCDLTSTYFEGQCPHNPQARRGYSRNRRSDGKQVVVGLVLDREGFPKAHEVFEGNRTDRTTMGDMLGALEARTGRHGNATVGVDRGMAFDDNH